MGSLTQLIRENRNVNREKSLHSTGVKPGHDRWQFNELEVVCPMSGLEGLTY
jgi:hypothetical protein